MKKLLAVVAVLAATAFPTASHAQFQLGVRLGYAGATGDEFKDKFDGTNYKMSDGLKSQIPLQLDAMYAVAPQIKVGAYFSYGFAQTGGDFKDLCDVSGVDCSTSEYRLGVQATYAFTTANPKFVPWAGLGIGYEWSSYSAEMGTSKIEQSLSGFEFATLQVGGDFKVNEKFSIGPYLTYGFAQYSGGEMKVQGLEALVGIPDGTYKFSDVADTSMHSWWNLGVAGKFDL